MKKILIAVFVVLAIVSAVYAASNMGLGLNQLTMKSVAGVGPSGDGFISTPGNYFISSDGNYFTSN